MVSPSNGDVLLLAEGFVLKRCGVSPNRRQASGGKVGDRGERSRESSNVWPLTALTKIVQIYVFNRAPDSRFRTDEMLMPKKQQHAPPAQASGPSMCLLVCVSVCVLQ